MRLTRKTTLAQDGQPPRTRRRYDRAQTPFDRRCASGVLSEEDEKRLKARREATNPRQLRQEIYELIDQLFALPGAVAGEREDVYQTLFDPQHAFEEEHDTG